MSQSGIERLAESGDQIAMAQIMVMHRPRLRAMLDFRIDPRVRSRIDPSDVLQEAFIEVSRRLPEYLPLKERVSLFVWMRRITMERLLMAHRRHLIAKRRDARRELSLRQQSSGNETSLSIAANLMAREESVSRQAVRAEQKAALMQLLEKMDDSEREVIAMRIFEGLSNGEVAQVLGLTKQKASRIFLRGVCNLKNELHHIGLTGLA